MHSRRRGFRAKVIARAAAAVMLGSALLVGPSGVAQAGLTDVPAAPVSYTTQQTNLASGDIQVDLLQGDKVIASVVGAPGTKVAYVEQVATEGGMGSESLALIPPGPTSADEQADMAAAYAKAGTSVTDQADALGFKTGLADPVDDAQAVEYGAEQTVDAEIHTVNNLAPDPLQGGQSLGGDEKNLPQVSTDTVGEKVGDLTNIGQLPTAAEGNNGKIYGSGCATIDNHVYWHGCFIRYTISESDSSNWYSMDTSEASGHGSSWNALTTGRTDHRYASSTTVVKWTPNAEQPSGECHTVTFTLGYSGTSASESFRLCPARITPDIIANSRFRVGWSGHSHSSVVGVAALDVMKAPAGRDSGFNYWISDQYCWC